MYPGPKLGIRLRLPEDLAGHWSGIALSERQKFQ
jgi:hypothetical protein